MHLSLKFYRISACLVLPNIKDDLKIIWGFLFFFQINYNKTSRDIADLLTISEGKFICTEWLSELIYRSKNF